VTSCVCTPSVARLVDRRAIRHNKHDIAAAAKRSCYQGAASPGEGIEQTLSSSKFFGTPSTLIEADFCRVQVRPHYGLDGEKDSAPGSSFNSTRFWYVVFEASQKVTTGVSRVCRSTSLYRGARSRAHDVSCPRLLRCLATLSHYKNRRFSIICQLPTIFGRRI
jgi:hypothetical protein